MNWDIVQGKWDQLRGTAKSKWGKLTDDDLQEIAGERDRLVGKLRERYGMQRDKAEREADLWIQQH